MPQNPHTHDFILREDYIELNRLLKFLNLAESGAAAKHAIVNGEAIVDKLLETRIRRKLRAGSVVNFRGHTITIRGKSGNRSSAKVDDVREDSAFSKGDCSANADQ